MAFATYSARVTFEYTLTLSDAEAELVRDVLDDGIQNGTFEDVSGDRAAINLARSVLESLRHTIEGAHRMGLVPRKPEHQSQPTEIIYPVKGE